MPHVSSESSTQHATLSIQYRPVAELHLDPDNPRQHGERQIRQIARSIEAFGFNVPVLVDGTLRVIAGHGRVLACRKLGWREVPTIELDHLNEAQIRAFNIADNRLTEISDWNETLLAEQLAELSKLDLEFSIEATGFDMGEIDLRIEGLTTPKTYEPDKADRFEVSSGPVVSRTGDVWQLGRHRLICGDALSSQTYETLMQGERAAMVFTDPPYNVPIEGNVGGLGKIRHQDFAMASGEMSRSEFTAFLEQACRLMADNSRDGTLQYICMDWRHMGELVAAGSTAFHELKNLCVWAKPNAGMGSLYRSQHELVFVFKHGRAAHRNNVALGRHGRNRSNIWQYASPASFGRIGEEGQMLALHPTVKPVAMVADAMLDCTARGEIVLDPFLGSGTTIIAAERVGRICYGIELDPAYVDTILRRYSSYAGQSAIHVSTGLAFEDLRVSREVGHV